MATINVKVTRPSSLSYNGITLMPGDNAVDEAAVAAMRETAGFKGWEAEGWVEVTPTKPAKPAAAPGKPGT